MSLSPTPRELQAARTRAELSKAALTLFMAYGIQHVTIDDICTACGVTKGAFYYYFPSKDHIIAYSVNHKLDGYLEEHFHFPTSRPAKERLLHLFQMTFSFFQLLGRPMTRYAYEGQTRSLIELKRPERFYVRLLSAIIQDAKQSNAFRVHLELDDCYMMLIILQTGFLFKWSATPEELDHRYDWDAILEEMVSSIF